MPNLTTSSKYYSFDGLCILVADDNRFVRSIVVTILKALGVGRVLQAENGEEAQAFLEVSAAMHGDAREVDIIMSDHLMEPGSGLDLLRFVRSHESEKVKFIPFIMMSGDADRKAVTDARDAGVTEYLAKPMSVIGVATKLLAVIDRPRAFIRTPDYFGPDRRRQRLPYEGPDKRKLLPDDVQLVDEGNHMVIAASSTAESLEEGGA